MNAPCFGDRPLDVGAAAAVVATSIPTRQTPTASTGIDHRAVLRMPTSVDGA